MFQKTFAREHDFLVCVDSDGCVMETMNIKHLECFGPSMVEEWDLEEWREPILDRWNQINLYSMTRGVNRFNALLMALREIDARYTPIEGLNDLDEFVKGGHELSNEALEEAIPLTGSVCLQKALNWSRNVNSRISLISMYQKLPFPGVIEALDKLHPVADVVIVSNANHQALEDEWTYYNMLGEVDDIMSQDTGAKDYCINKLLEHGYEKDRVIMIGDAPADRDAALATGVHFFPVLVNHEAESWTEFVDDAMPRLLEGRFDEAYQQLLHERFLKNLSR